MKFTDKNMYELLPVVYRVRDVEQNDALKQLVSIIADQAKVVEDNISSLYNNWFIETCEEWVIPYIADLLGVRNLHTIKNSAAVSQRAYVANTISYRRRKGIAPVLEQLALDITGWRSHVVEFFEFLQTSQYMNHTRLHRPVTPDLRKMDQLDLVNTAFDTIAHSADMRHISSGRGRYNIPNIGLFTWRLQSYPLVECDAFAYTCPAISLFSPPSSPLSPPSVVKRFFTFNPIGNNCQLFNQPRTEESITHISNEINVPGLLRRRALFDELEARRHSLVNNTTPVYNYFDQTPEPGETITTKHFAFEIFKNEEIESIPPEEILICNLQKCCLPPQEELYKKMNADGTFSEEKKKITVAADPVMGRFIFTDQNISAARVSYCYGFSGDIGAGPYNRQGSVPEIYQAVTVWHAGVSKTVTRVAGEKIFPTIQQAIDEWNNQSAQTTGVITIMDSRTYLEDLHISLKEKSQLIIIAADWPLRDVTNGTPGQRQRMNGDISADKFRPHIHGDMTIIGEGTGNSKELCGEILLNGLLVQGKVSVLEGQLGILTAAHCTIMPGMGGLEMGADTIDPKSNQWLSITLNSSICGTINLNKTIADSLWIEDSIVDTNKDFGSAASINADSVPVQLKRTTVFGTTVVKTIEAENCIFNDIISAVRTQTGCIRFSYITPGNIGSPLATSRTPRRYRCQPDMEITSQIDEAKKTGTVLSFQQQAITDTVRGWLVPAFTSVHYDDHGYAQLSIHCPSQITSGADDGSEMGAFSYLQQPQRQANLRIALDEYLRFGLEAGIIYVT